MKGHGFFLGSSGADLAMSCRCEEREGEWGDSSHLEIHLLLSDPRGDALGGLMVSHQRTKSRGRASRRMYHLLRAEELLLRGRLKRLREVLGRTVEGVSERGKNESASQRRKDVQRDWLQD